MKIKLIAFFMISILILGSASLIIGLQWSAIAGPILESRMSQEEDDEGDLSFTSEDGSAFMEGRIGLMSLIWDSIDGEDPLKENEFPTIEMFETIWRNVEITNDGMIDIDTGEPLFEDFDSSFSSEEGQTFPTGGVGKRDYEIYNQALDRNVVARYVGEKSIFNRLGYVYEVDIEDEVLDEAPQIPGNDDEGSAENPLPFEGDTDYIYSDRSRYVLDPATSIPLDIDVNIASGFIFPDSKLLPVLERNVQYADETIWMPHPTIPGRMESQDVIKETVTEGRISEEDELIAYYEVHINYYDAYTGEPLSEEVQGPVDRFAVNRETYTYMTGFENTDRSGYYQFPIGTVEKRDYPMWDESINSENTAVYIGEDMRAGQRTLRYRMTTTDVEVEAGNAILPIYYHPGTTYMMDTIQEWFIDAETGFMLDFTIDGTIRVTSSGPFGIVDESVGSFSVDLPDNTTETLLTVSELFRDFLIPMSEKKINAFSMEIGFTDSTQRFFVDLSEQVGFYLDLFQRQIPTGLITAGIILLSIPLVILVTITIRKRRNRLENQVMIAEEIY